MASAAPHLEAFLEAAKYFLGVTENPLYSNKFTSDKGKEMIRLAGQGSGCAWCAILVSACAQKAGIAGKLIFKNSGAGPVTGRSVDYYNATWIPGPYFTRGEVRPMPGDLITIVGKPASTYSGYDHAGHIGIVEYVDDDGVHTIEGNTDTQNCKRCLRGFSATNINGYCRPDWVSLGDNVSAYLGGVGYVGPLYQTRNDRHDMTLREVGYLNTTDYKLSDTRSAINISVINYTSVLGDLYDIFAPMAVSNPVVNTDQLKGNIKIAMDYLLSMGFSASAASGIAGAIKAYSNIKPDFKMSASGVWRYGICIWGPQPLKELKLRLGVNWDTNLSGQLKFLTDDLIARYSGVVGALKLQTLDAETAEKVAEAFVALYTNDLKDVYTTNAKLNAAEIYEQLIITQNTIIGSISNLVDKNGNPLSSKNSITIPASVPQTGIIDDYTSYSAWFYRWAKSSPQRKLANLWQEQGYPCDKGVAKIGGYYCVAVRPKFGRCGEVIVITLEGGEQFSAIICDEKGEDAGSEWGHVKGGGKISLIEWERVKTDNGKVVVGNIGFTNVDSCGFGTWRGKKVMNITNYGKYVDVRWT